MRLLQVTASDVWRGHEQKIIYLYEAFRDYGYVEDQLIVCQKDTIIYNVAKEKNMNVVGLEFKSEYDLSFAKQLKQVAEEHKVDVVFIHNSQSHTSAVLASLLFGLKQPLVLCRTLIKRVDTNFFRKWKYNYKGIKKILCITQPVVDILKIAVKDHSKLSIVGILTDVNKFTKTKKNGMLHKEFNIPEDYKIIGNIAAFSDFKDHITFVNTVEQLVKEDIKAKYILVGKGPLEQEIRDLAKSKALENDIIFAGFRTDIPEILPEFDLFLFTSNNEPAGGVILESYACRVPVVAANAGGIPELLIHNETGLLAEVGNAKDFSEKVMQLMRDENLRDRLITSGHDFLMKNHTKEVIAKQMFEALNEVVLAEKK